MFHCVDIKYSPGTQKVANSEALGDTDYVWTRNSQQSGGITEKDWQDHTRWNTETENMSYIRC